MVWTAAESAARPSSVSVRRSGGLVIQNSPDVGRQFSALGHGRAACAAPDTEG
jgi:hypothetical protein